jgi:hypothetical protein
MSRSPLLDDDYKRPVFSGHETFPLRYGWLKKVYDQVVASQGDPGGRTVFASDDAIARFGVGKNMVGSMRHWATACGVIREDSLQPTPFGHFLFNKDAGVDPYLENPASLWLLHWHLCSGEAKASIRTTWYWVFNHFTAATFQRDDLVEGLLKLAQSRQWPRVSTTTVQRDVDCFVRTYAVRAANRRETVEESLESVFAELGLLRGVRNQMHLVRGQKRTLATGVFIYALMSFWSRLPINSTLSFEAIAHHPGSPGRVFLLDESDLSGRLSEISDVTEGAIRWSETAGLKQLVRSDSYTQGQLDKVLGNAFSRHLEVVS